MPREGEHKGGYFDADLADLKAAEEAATEAGVNLSALRVFSGWFGCLFRLFVSVVVCVSSVFVCVRDCWIASVVCVSSVLFLCRVYDSRC